MTSPKSLLFLAIQQRLAAIQVIMEEGGDPEPLLKFTAMDRGQLENYVFGSGELPAVDWPCALVNIGTGKFTDIATNAQQGDITVDVRLGFPPYDSTDFSTPAKYRNQSLYIDDIEDAVHKVLQGWRPGQVIVVPAVEADPEATPPVEAVEAVTANIGGIYKKLSRRAFENEERRDLITVRKIIYTLGMDDYSTKPIPATAPATLNISSSFILPA